MTLVSPHNDLDTLRDDIVKRYSSLSGRLQQVADFLMAQPMFVAVETMATIADKANVPLSTLSRFANAMGFSGFSQMQVLFRDQYLNRPRDYRERVRQAQKHDELPVNSTQAIFQDYGHVNVEAIEQLQVSISTQKMERAIELMNQAGTIYLHGLRRAYPVAYYLWYALLKSDNDVVLLDDTGGMLKPMTRRITSDDVLITVTFSPYAEETTGIIELAHQNNVPVVAITDNQMNAQGSMIDVCFEVQEGEVMGFRSLSSSMYLAQTLAVSLMCQQNNKE